MSYTVLARKYRPQTFDDLVGQEHVARTLKNAIEGDRVAHAFLFTGVRGVGKTSTARLLAKSLNCETGPTATPCNQCSRCRDITSGVDVDVQEIDGASNNSVEDVRRLQETLPFLPQSSRFKIVIVDEVHMLSTGAFNAFLKTLEEPPAHVKFIFATTEAHKVPITIRSRCQQYDFRLISEQVIGEKLTEILQAESIDADAETVAIVAREAAGSMRDALTLLDQLVAICGNNIHADDVNRNLGLAPRKLIHAVVRALLNGDPKEIIAQLSKFARDGGDVYHFAKQLLALLRDLVVLKLGASEHTLLEFTEDERSELHSMIDKMGVLTIERAFVATSRCVQDMNHATDPSLILEMGLVRVATRPSLEPIETLVSRLEALKSASFAAALQTRRAPTAAAPLRKTATATAETETSTRSRPNDARRNNRVLQRARRRLQKLHRLPPRLSDQCPLASVNKTQPGAPSHFDARRFGMGTHCRRAETTNRRLQRSSNTGIPRSVSGEQIVISFKKGSFYGRQAQSSQSQSELVAIAHQIYGQTPAIEIRFDADADSSTKTVAAVNVQRQHAELEARKRDALNHPTVRDAAEVFSVSPEKIEVQIDTEERGAE
ncbi:MAG: DNA polymerase III subunit gamma/tau [Polyangiales bacterium]